MRKAQSSSKAAPEAGASAEEEGDRGGRLAWGIMTPEEMARPGAVLIALIFQAAKNKNLRPAETCDALGISYSYFTALRNGGKPISKISDEMVDKIAVFLQLPKIVVMLAAGQLKLEDFFYVGEDIDSLLPVALNFIQNDPGFGPFMPLAVFSSHRDLQLFLVMLYEKATGKTVLPARVEPGAAVRRFESLLGGVKTS
jgi:hypothetical protein